jgi:hypothetical protein
MQYQKLTSEQLYVRIIGFVLALIAAVIWIFSSLKVEIIPDLIKVQVPSWIGIVAFAVFILIIVTLIIDFIKIVLIEPIFSATAGILYAISKEYGVRPTFYKFLFTTIAVITLIPLLVWIFLSRENYIQTSGPLILTYFVMLASKVAGEYLIPDKADTETKNPK